MRLALTGLVAHLVMGLSLAPVATAQEAGAGGRLEVIVSASGEMAAPWVTRELCQKSTGRCAMAVTNPETGEVARMGDVLGSDFELTGNGQELRRAETAIDKAIRLRAGLVNTETREIAKVGDRWATGFALTGNQKEVRRVGREPLRAP